MNRKVYADNAATTAVSPQVLEAMLPFYKEVYGNPSSLYALGQEAKRPLEEARAVAVLPPKVETVWETVKTLKPMDRGALYLFYYEGYSTGEIAQMLRVSQSSVTSRLCRARKKLKEQLEQEGYHETGV